MIRVSVLYPSREGARFDHAYYARSHMPLVEARLKGSGLLRYEIDRGIAGGAPGSPAPFAHAPLAFTPGRLDPGRRAPGSFSRALRRSRRRAKTLLRPAGKSSCQAASPGPTARVAAPGSIAGGGLCLDG